MPLHALLLFLGALPAVKALHKDFAFDIIDGHYIYPDGLAAVWLGKAFKKPVVLSARGSDINQFSRFRTIKPMIRAALKGADGVISVCDALKREMVELGAHEDKIRVIPNGIDSKKFFLKDSQQAKMHLKLPLTNKMILSVGSLIPRKGFQHLISAMPDVLKSQPDARLYIVGEGAYRKALERQIEDLELQERVFLVGECPNAELMEWYNAADVFCLASSREGWANVLMEAMACGCPVVATNVYGAPEIVTKKEVGRLVSQDPGSLAQALIEALASEWSRDRIRQHVIERDWSVVAREVEHAFHNVLEGCTA